LAYTACLVGHSILFTTAVDALNALIAAQAAGRLKTDLNRYLKPRLLCLDIDYFNQTMAKPFRRTYLDKPLKA